MHRRDMPTAHAAAFAALLLLALGATLAIHDLAGGGFLLGAGVAVSGRFEDAASPVAQGPYAPTAGIGYLGLLGAGLFALAAAVVALALDKRADRRP